TRLGTPTGKSSSGTVEEIEEHVAADKPAMIYFSSKPVAPESIDAEQFAQVQAIRKKWQPRGLIETYDNLEEFRRKLAKHIHVCISKNEYIKNLLLAHIVGMVAENLAISNTQKQYVLSEESKIVLKAAASVDDGTILRMSFLGGGVIQAGGESFG